MTHPIALDPAMPDVLRRVFSRVTHQIVRYYSDTTEWSYNLNSEQTARRDEIRTQECRRLGQLADGKRLLAVKIREI